MQQGPGPLDSRDNPHHHSQVTDDGAESYGPDEMLKNPQYQALGQVDELHENDDQFQANTYDDTVTSTGTQGTSGPTLPRRDYHRGDQFGTGMKKKARMNVPFTTASTGGQNKYAPHFEELLSCKTFNHYLLFLFYLFIYLFTY